jgi:hypothetical protein
MYKCSVGSPLAVQWHSNTEEACSCGPCAQASICPWKAKLAAIVNLRWRPRPSSNYESKTFESLRWEAGTRLAALGINSLVWATWRCYWGDAAEAIPHSARRTSMLSPCSKATCQPTRSQAVARFASLTPKSYNESSRRQAMLETVFPRQLCLLHTPESWLQQLLFSILTISWLSNLVTMFPRASGSQRQGPSWTAVYMSSPVCKFDFESWSKLKPRFKMEKIMKEWVWLIQILSIIFTVAVGRILTKSLKCIL